VKQNVQQMPPWPRQRGGNVTIKILAAHYKLTLPVPAPCTYPPSADQPRSDELGARPESQRDSGSKPRVGAPRPPWEGSELIPQPQRGCGLDGARRSAGRNPVGVGVHWRPSPRVAPKAFGATLGFGPQSLWDWQISRVPYLHTARNAQARLARVGKRNRKPRLRLELGARIGYKSPTLTNEKCTPCRQLNLPHAPASRFDAALPGKSGGWGARQTGIHE
jgi:hypothetical protein